MTAIVTWNIQNGRGCDGICCRNGRPGVYSARYAGKHLSLIQGVEDEDDRDDQTIMGPFEFTLDPPQSNSL